MVHHDESSSCIMMTHHAASWWFLMMHQNDSSWCTVSNHHDASWSLIMMHHEQSSWCIMKGDENASQWHIVMHGKLAATRLRFKEECQMSSQNWMQWFCELSKGVGDKRIWLGSGCSQFCDHLPEPVYKMGSTSEQTHGGSVVARTSWLYGNKSLLSEPKRNDACANITAC